MKQSMQGFMLLVIGLWPRQFVYACLLKFTHCGLHLEDCSESTMLMCEMAVANWDSHLVICLPCFDMFTMECT